MRLFKRPKPQAQSHRVSRIQIIAACLGLAVIIACTAILVQAAISGSYEALPSVSIDSVKPTANGREIKVTVSNPSSQTLADVTISATVSGKTMSNTLDYLPAEGTRTLSFIVLPQGSIDIAIESWMEP